ncbi:hypothetical protein D3C74_359070 [compost metagenome]
MLRRPLIQRTFSHVRKGYLYMVGFGIKGRAFLRDGVDATTKLVDASNRSYPVGLALLS